MGFSPERVREHELEHPAHVIYAFVSAFIHEKLLANCIHGLQCSAPHAHSAAEIEDELCVVKGEEGGGHRMRAVDEGGG